MKIWIDIANPSHALFFNSIIKNFNFEDIIITVRNRAETIQLVESFGMQALAIGKDSSNRIKKPFQVLNRTQKIYRKIKDFDFVISLENTISITVSKLRKRKSILFCDNDLKFLQRKSVLQDIETVIKSMANNIIIPIACKETFQNHINKEKIITFNGYKEDIYIADFIPNLSIKKEIPFKDFIVIRPEALGSFYVKEKKSIVPTLLNRFEHENIDVLYLPREKEDFEYSKGFNPFIPKRALNGLDLSYYSNAILTGSGTMAREAACMGTTSVSFFPSTTLLSVDKQLVNEKKIFHSRNVEDIVEHVVSNYDKKRSIDFTRCKAINKEAMSIINKIIE